MRHRVAAFTVAALVGCTEAEDPPPREPVAIAGCTTCAPGDLMGGTFFPEWPRWLRASPNGTLVQVVHDGKGLALLDENLGDAGLLPLVLEDERITDLEIDDSLTATAVVSHVTVIENNPNESPVREEEITLRSFAPSGALRWSRVLVSGVRQSRFTLATAGDSAFVTGDYGFAQALTAYATADGSQRWRVDDEFKLVAAGGDRVVAVEIELAAIGWITRLHTFDLAGAPVWVLTIANDTFPYGVSVDAQGRVALVGRHGGGLDLGGGSLGASRGWFVARFARDGAFEWAHPIGASDYLEYHAIAPAGDGLALGAHFYNEPYDVGGAPVAPTGFDAVTLFVDASGPRWRAFVTGNESQVAEDVVALPDRIITTIDCLELDNGPITSVFGGTVAEGSGTAYVRYAR